MMTDKPEPECPDCGIPLTVTDHAATCPQCDWTTTAVDMLVGRETLAKMFERALIAEITHANGGNADSRGHARRLREGYVADMATRLSCSDGLVRDHVMIGATDVMDGGERLSTVADNRVGYIVDYVSRLDNPTRPRR